MKDDMNYMQSQPMRNNLIFGNIPEETNETPVRSEQIIKDYHKQIKNCERGS